MKPQLYIQGMHGLGDNLHQRAIIRQLMQTYAITLETSWPSVYHDLDIKFASRRVALRTQQKNSEREAGKFSAMRHGPGMRSMRIAYGGAQVLGSPSKTILEVMCNVTGTSFNTADYRLPIPQAWKNEAAKIIGPLPLEGVTKPWMVYRPLVVRPEWRGSAQRNADAASYAELFSRIRDDFFVISVADLEDGKEWIIGPDAKPDLTFHRGELHFEALAALFAAADLVFTSSGFAAILAPAVGTPCISIGGGYEDPRCHESGAKFAPFLSIGPMAPCSCWTSACRKVCDKKINMLTAIPEIEQFVFQHQIGGTR